MECLGGNGYVEESGMPRLYREAPLTSIWEGSGNVMSLDVLRALSRSPRSLEVFLEEVEQAAGADPRLDASVARAEVPVHRPRDARDARAARRRSDGSALQGSLLVRYAAARRRRRLLRRAPGGDGGPGVRHAARAASTSRRSSPAAARG